MRARVLAQLVLVGLMASACQSSESAGPAIIIASDLPVTSDPSALVPLQQAIQYVIRQRGSIGGLRLEYMPLDDAFAGQPSPEKGLQNINLIIANTRVVGVIGPYNSNIAKQVIPVANRASLVMLSPANTNVCLTIAEPTCNPGPKAFRPSGINNYFRIAAPDPFQGRAMARYAGGTLHVKRVAVFNEWSDEGALYVDEFRRELAQYGGEVVLERDIDQRTEDFTQFLKEAKADGADAVYALGEVADYVCRARAQMNSLMPDAYFLATDGIEGHKTCISDAVDPRLMYATRSDVDAATSIDAQVAKDVAAYRKAYPKASDIVDYTYAAYDCASILVDAIAKAVAANQGGFPTRRQVLDLVAQTNQFKGLTGTYSFDANGDAISPMMSLYEVKNGAWAYLQPIDARAR